MNFKLQENHFTTFVTISVASTDSYILFKGTEVKLKNLPKDLTNSVLYNTNPTWPISFIGNDPRRDKGIIIAMGILNPRLIKIHTHSAISTSHPTRPLGAVNHTASKQDPYGSIAERNTWSCSYFSYSYAYITSLKSSRQNHRPFRSGRTGPKHLPR